MSSSPSPLARPGRVIRRPGSTLPPATVVAPRSAFPAAVVAEGGTSLETLLEAARREAYEDGYRAGREEALESVEARRAETVAALAADLRRAAGEVASLRAGVVDEVLADAMDLAYELLEVLVGRELLLAEAPVRDALARALALVPDGDDLVVRVHPDCGLDDSDVAALGVQAGVQVVRDPSVDPHGCQLVIGACHLDVQVPAALGRVRRALEELRPTSEEGQDATPHARQDGADWAADGSDWPAEDARSWAGGGTDAVEVPA